MFASLELSREIPYLRRFARALCGSQVRGDSEVESLLRRLLADKTLLEGGGSARVVLFRSLLRSWNSATGTSALCEMLLMGQSSGADKSLAGILPRPRQAFLLSSLENFSTEEVQQILEVSELQLGAWLREARAQIVQQSATSVLIIEDELLIATMLEMLVTDMGHFVHSIARTRDQALSAVAQMKQYLTRPGLILADIHLADGSSGIDAVNRILGDGDIPVIFITAYPERLLTGQRIEPTYLLNKPFTEDALRSMICQALFFNSGSSQPEAHAERRIA